jgi:ABC-type transport system involved in multi-copper enzyme maturation permease subunit
MKSLISKHIIKQSIRNSWKMWLIITAFLCFFIAVLTFVINSNMAEMGRQMGGSVSMLSFYGQYFTGQASIIILIYVIVVGNRLVASEVDKGSLSFTLNTPITRKQVIVSKALFFIISIALMLILIGLTATFSTLIASVDKYITISNPISPISTTVLNMDYGILWRLIFGVLLFTLTISGISFASSSYFNKSSQSLLVGAGLPVTFWLDRKSVV